MKKIISLICFIIFFGLNIKAQTTEDQMATLQHGDKTTVFYGIDAFKSAYDAAADSADVITLSSGEFNVPDYIQKSLSIYGAGFEEDSVNGVKPTILNNYLNIKHADGVDDDGKTTAGSKHVNNMHIEGICLNSIYFYNNNNIPYKNFTFVKCLCNFSMPECYTYNFIIRQCVCNYISFSNQYTENFYATNSFFGELCNGSNTSNTAKFDHCIIKAVSNFYFGNFTNNILYSTLRTSMTGTKNIFINQSSTGLSAANDIDNYVGKLPEGIFTNAADAGDYAANKTFALKYPTKYIGTDGTQIGLYGGNYSWNKIPSTPRIISSSIDLKTTADGKLNVSLKGEAQTKD